jgi:hypothetical protein
LQQSLAMTAQRNRHRRSHLWPNSFRYKSERQYEET